MFFTVLILIPLIGFADRWLIQRANKKIWQSTRLDKIARYLPFPILFFLVIWFAGSQLKISWLLITGASGSSILLLLNLFLFLTVPFSSGIALLDKFIRKTTKKNIPADSSRRLFLKSVAASVPVAALGGLATGLVSAYSKTDFPQIKMHYTDLPDALDGFKILQLSDLHLGYYFGLDHLEQTLMDAEKFQVHMVVVTGDIADDLNLMTDAMRMIDQLKTPFSKFVSIGNHEYFRGITASIQNINAGPIPLLLNQHHLVDVHGTKLLIGGVDDPVRLRSSTIDFFDKSLQKTFFGSPDCEFKMLLSHRPRALDIAESYSIDLVLAGHTHGGQVGLAGKSMWEIFNENGYLWGSYKKGASQLYTTSGMGHWFPFRLNCPLEAPVITLTKLS